MTEEDLQLLLDSLEAHSDVIIVFDRSGALRWGNRAARALTDLPMEEVRGLRLVELSDRSPRLAGHRPFYEILDTYIGEIMATGGEHADDDASRVTPEGEVIAVSHRIHAVHRGDEVVGAVWVVRDQTEDASLMFRRAAVAMAHLTRQGTVREANSALLDLLGRDEIDPRGREVRFVDLVHPDDQAEARAAVERVLDRQVEEARAMVRFTRPDGSVRWTDLSIAPNGMGTGQGPGSGGACVILQDVTERVILQVEVEAAQDRLRELAMHDPLTGLPNRAHLQDELADAQRRAKVSGGHVAVLFIDLDGFKQVNDSAGHETGDRLLVQAGERLKRLLRPDDLAARLGGDEFVLCCTDLAADPVIARTDADRIAERARASLVAPFEIDGRQWRLGASIGIALSAAGDEDPASLLRHADAEMYRVKARR